jgi:hypothetical protein
LAVPVVTYPNAVVGDVPRELDFLSLDPPMRFVVSVDEYFGIGLVRDRLISPMT